MLGWRTSYEAFLLGREQLILVTKQPFLVPHNSLKQDWCLFFFLTVFFVSPLPSEDRHLAASSASFAYGLQKKKKKPTKETLFLLSDAVDAFPLRTFFPGLYLIGRIPPHTRTYRMNDYATKFQVFFKVFSPFSSFVVCELLDRVEEAKKVKR